MRAMYHICVTYMHKASLSDYMVRAILREQLNGKRERENVNLDNK